jgi:hypothetical protein
MGRQHGWRSALIVAGVVSCGIAVALIASSGGALVRPRGCYEKAKAEVCSVLFVGNSYTYVNGLPAIFAKLARSGRRAVEAGIDAQAGASLGKHITSGDIKGAMKLSRWNVVVLQEQSEIPAIPSLRNTYMYPAVRQLVATSQDSGAQAILFLTWAHRDGWPAQGLVGYSNMQSAVDVGYLKIARQLRVAVAPVGYAWAATLAENPSARLWRDDGSHPTVEGTYLAACVFYAAIFGESPERLLYHADLPIGVAAVLRRVAAKIVLGQPARWGLG